MTPADALILLHRPFVVNTLEYEQGIVRYEKCFANNGAPDVLEEIGTQLLYLFEIK